MIMRGMCGSLAQESLKSSSKAEMSHKLLMVSMSWHVDFLKF